jgi:hypothetical protein
MFSFKNILAIFLFVQVINCLYIKQKETTDLVYNSTNENVSSSEENSKENEESSEYDFSNSSNSSNSSINSSNSTHKEDSENYNQTEIIECHKLDQNDDAKPNNSIALLNSTSAIYDSSTDSTPGPIIDINSTNSSSNMTQVDKDQPKNLFNSTSDTSYNSTKFNSTELEPVPFVNSTNSSSSTFNMTIDSDQPKILEFNVSDASWDQNNKSISTDSPIIKPANRSCIISPSSNATNSSAFNKDQIINFISNNTAENDDSLTDMSDLPIAATDLPIAEVKPVNISQPQDIGGKPVISNIKASKTFIGILKSIRNFFSKLF